MIKHAIAIAFCIYSANTHDVEKRFIIEHKAKIHIATQVYTDANQSFINKNFNKYKDSIFNVVPEMIVDCKLKTMKNDMYLFEHQNLDANCCSAGEWNYLVLYNMIYEKLHKAENIINRVKQHYSSYSSKIEKAISDCNAYYKALQLGVLLESDISNVTTEGNNILLGKIYNGMDLVYNTENKQFYCIAKSTTEPNFDEINTVKFDDYLKIVYKQFNNYRIVINKTINCNLGKEVYGEDLNVYITDSSCGKYSFIKYLHICQKYQDYTIDVIIPGLINGKQTLYSDESSIWLYNKGNLIFRKQDGKNVKIIRPKYESGRLQRHECSLFRGLKNIKMIDLTGADTNGLEDMSEMFAQPAHPTSLETIKGLTITSKVKDMHKMFYLCVNLTDIDTKKFDTSNVADMNKMFMGCSKLKKLDLSVFNTNKVQSMTYMFSCCYNLQELDLSTFRTDNVMSMHGMFSACKSLKDLDLSSFNTAKVIHMGCMFKDMCNLQSLNIKSFDTRCVKYMNAMFFNCCSLLSLDLRNFVLDSCYKQSHMFTGCTSLINIQWTEPYKLEQSAYENCNSLIKLVKN